MILVLVLTALEWLPDKKRGERSRRSFANLALAIYHFARVKSIAVHLMMNPLADC